MTIKLSAQLRKSQEKLGPDSLPGVLYGKGIDNKNLQLKRVDFDKAFGEAGESNLIDLSVGEDTVKVLVKEVQRNVLKNYYTHVDFYQVNMKEKIKTEIPLHFIGEAKAVRELGGALIKDIDAIEVECLPSDLVDHIDVDISVLNTFEDAIHINDLKLPAGLTLLRHTNDVVAAVKEPKVEAEPEPVAEGAAAETAATGEAAPAEGEKKEPEKKQ
ncbi:MAG: 50S ribosomal protein L25 [Patescibacteria group bacterium]